MAMLRDEPSNASRQSDRTRDNWPRPLRRSHTGSPRTRQPRWRLEVGTLLVSAGVGRSGGGRAALKARHIETTRAQERGALKTLSSNAAYRVRGDFDPEETMAVFNGAIEQAARVRARF